MWNYTVGYYYQFKNSCRYLTWEQLINKLTRLIKIRDIQLYPETNPKWLADERTCVAEWNGFRAHFHEKPTLSRARDAIIRQHVDNPKFRDFFGFK